MSKTNRIKEMKETNKIVVWMAIGAVISAVIFGCSILGWNRYKTIERDALQRGANVVVGSILQQLNQNGEVVINNGNRQIILVPKEAPVDPNAN